MAICRCQPTKIKYFIVNIVSQIILDMWWIILPSFVLLICPPSTSSTPILNFDLLYSIFLLFAPYGQHFLIKYHIYSMIFSSTFPFGSLNYSIMSFTISEFIFILIQCSSVSTTYSYSTYVLYTVWLPTGTNSFFSYSYIVLCTVV